MTETSGLTLTKGQLKAVAAAISTDTKRLEIRRIRIEHDAVLATDGHRLHRVKLADEKAGPDCEPYHASPDDVNAILRSLAKGQSVALHGGDQPCARIEERIRIELEPTTDQEYPNYRKVFPSAELQKSVVSVNARYLKEIAEAALDAGERFLGIEIRGELEPVLIIGRWGGFDAVLMPMKWED